MIYAETKAAEMLNLPKYQLPPLALLYVQHMYSIHGAATEIALTAFAHFNQAVEGMKCNDPSYEIDENAKKWFEENT